MLIWLFRLRVLEGIAQDMSRNVLLECEGELMRLTITLQLHTTPGYKEELKKYGLEPLQFDGMGEMYVKSIADWVKFQGSPAFSETLVSR
jgi:hypothetical protein